MPQIILQYRAFVAVDIPVTVTDDEPEAVWSAFNRHDAPDQHPMLNALGLPSMSVGDGILYPSGRRVVAASFGFTEEA